MGRHAELSFDIVEGHEHLGSNALLAWFHPRACVHVSRYHTAYHTLVSRGLANWPAFKIIEWLDAIGIRKAHARISASAFIEAMTREDFPGAPPCDAVIPLFSHPLTDDPPPPLEGRERQLRQLLGSFDSVLVAFSGGVDRDRKSTRLNSSHG